MSHRLIVLLLVLGAPLSGCAISPEAQERKRQLELHMEYGAYWFQHGAFAQASDQFSKVLALDPDNAKALTGRAYSYTAIGLQDLAIKDFLTLRDDQGPSTEIDLGLGFSHYMRARQTHREVQRRELLQEELKQTEPEKHAQFVAEVQRLRQSAIEDCVAARGYMEPLLKDKTNQTNAYLLQTLALTYAEQAFGEGGFTHYPRAAELMERYVRVGLEVRSKFAADLKTKFSTLTDAQVQAYKTQIDHVKTMERRARVFLAFLYYAQWGALPEAQRQANRKQLDHAIAHINEVVKLSGRTATQHLTLAGLYHERGEFDQSVKQVEAYLKKNPLGSAEMTLYARDLMQEFKDAKGGGGS